MTKRNYGPDRPCTLCGRRPPEVEFLVRPNGRRNSRCRSCSNKTDRRIRGYGPDRPCSQCGRSAPEVEFGVRSDGKRPAHCKECINTKEAQRRAAIKEDPERYAESRRRNQEAQERSIAKNPEQYRERRKARRLLARYGLTLATARQLWHDQGEACGVCREPISDPSLLGRNGVHVDHCHATGAVRGLLCETCNMMLGSAKDNPAVLRAGAAWLEAHQVSAVQCELSDAGAVLPSLLAVT